MVGGLRLPFGGINKNPSLANLTPIGKQKLETSNITGPVGMILWYLKEHGASSVKEVSSETGIVAPKAKAILNQYSGKDYKWVEWV